MRLSREKRDQLRAGGAPRLVFPGDEPCPLEPGQVLPVCSGMELVVQRIRKSKKGEHVAVYMIRDHRVRLPRRVPPAHATSRGHLDEHGMPSAPTAEEIELARREGGVTSSKRLAVPGLHLAENLDDDEQRSVTAKAHDQFVVYRNEEAAEEEQRRQQRAFRDRLKETLHGLSLAEGQVLLAELERSLERAKMKEAA